MNTFRLVIYPKDIAAITGKSERYGRFIIASIKKKCNREKTQLVTIKEYCDFSGLDYEVVLRYLR
jgi:hypothetical protein